MSNRKAIYKNPKKVVYKLFPDDLVYKVLLNGKFQEAIFISKTGYSREIKYTIRALAEIFGDCGYPVLCSGGQMGVLVIQALRSIGVDYLHLSKYTDRITWK